MKVHAAIDLKGGRIVQLVGGDPAAEVVSLSRPAVVARRWVNAGFTTLHVVDLDAALGHGDNDDEIRLILRSVSVPVHVGGGVRTRARARALVDAGAAKVIVGTRAIADPEWLARVATEFPGRLVVAADVRGGRVATHGWTEDSGLDLDDVLRRIDPLPLGGILITDVDREGRMPGVDVDGFARAAAGTRHPVVAAGGISGDDDLRRLAHTGVSAAVVGMALYKGAATLTEIEIGPRSRVELTEDELKEDEERTP